MDPIRKLARRITAVEKLAFRASVQPQLAYSSIEDGAIQSIVDGALHMIMGRQFDGTQTIAIVNGPPPPTPVAATTESVIDGANIRWDGTWTNGDVAPMNYGRVEVHASIDPNFPANQQTTLVGFFESPRGGVVYASLVPNNYFIKLVAVTQSGVRGVPSSAVTVIPTSFAGLIDDPDGNATIPPDGSPAIIVSPSAQGFSVRADEAQTTVRISYLVSATPGFLPDAANLYAGPTRRNPVYLSSPDFLPGVIYYFKTVASNGAGVGTPGPEVSSELDLVTSEQIVSLDVDKLEAGSMFVRGELQASFALLGLLQVGTNITIDPDGGITIVQLNGQITHLAADGSGNQFAGQGTFDSAIFNDRVSINGLQNALNGIMALGSGVPDPTSIPIVTVDYDGIGYDASPVAIFGRGLIDNAAGDKWLFPYTADDGRSYIVSIDKVTGAQISLDGIPAQYSCYGMTRIGSTYYTLGNDGARSGSPWYVFAYDSSWVKIREWALPYSVGDFKPIIGKDISGNILTAGTVGNNVYVRTHDATTGAFTSLNCGAWTNVDLTSVSKVGMRFYVSSRTEHRAFDSTTGVRSTVDEWPKAPGSIYGLWHDGTVWHQLASGTIHHFTTNSGTYDFGFTWLDDQVGQVGYPVLAETKVSKLRTMAPARFARWRMHLPAAPSFDGTVNGANTGRFYAGPAGGALTRQVTLAAGAMSAIIPVSTTGGTPPTTSGFGARAGAIGRLQSIAKTAGGAPLISIGGDGLVSIPHKIQGRYEDTGTLSGGGAINSIPIVYPIPFPVGIVPVVHCDLMITTPSSDRVIAPSSVTNTGFTARVSATATTAMPFSWIALAP